MYRVEDKYGLTSNHFYILKKRLGAIMPSDGNSLGDAGYKISSVYFDDIYDTHFIDTVNGNPVRQKFRIRIYNDSFDTIKAEVKFKKYNRIKKLSKSIRPDQMQCLLNGESAENEGVDLDDPVLLFNMAIKARVLRPKVIVTYERTAFVREFGNVRITFDSNVRGSDRISDFGKRDLTYDFPEGENSVLEVKYDEFLPDYIAQTLEVNYMWQSSFSKYGICRELYI